MECSPVNRDGRASVQKVQEIAFFPTVAVKETEDQKVSS